MIVIEQWLRYYDNLPWYKRQEIWLSLQKVIDCEIAIKWFGEMYSGDKNDFIFDYSLIVTNVSIDHQMDSE